MQKNKYIGVFLGGDYLFGDKESLDGHAQHLGKLIDQYGSESKNLIITNQKSELKIKSRNKFEVIQLKTRTRGALTSLAFSLDHIETDAPVVVFPTNSKIETNISKFVELMELENYEAGVICFESNDINFSYMRIRQGEIIEFKEKEIIGDLATTGIFYFRNKSHIINCLEWCLVNNINTNGIYYLAPSLNYFVCNGISIGFDIIPTKNYTRINKMEPLT